MDHVGRSIPAADASLDFATSPGEFIKSFEGGGSLRNDQQQSSSESLTVKINTVKLESYLKSIKKQIRDHDVLIREQRDAANDFSSHETNSSGEYVKQYSDGKAGTQDGKECADNDDNNDANAAGAVENIAASPSRSISFALKAAHTVLLHKTGAEDKQPLVVGESIPLHAHSSSSSSSPPPVSSSSSAAAAATTAAAPLAVRSRSKRKSSAFCRSFSRNVELAFLDDAGPVVAPAAAAGGSVKARHSFAGGRPQQQLQQQGISFNGTRASLRKGSAPPPSAAAARGGGQQREGINGSGESSDSSGGGSSSSSDINGVSAAAAAHRGQSFGGLGGSISKSTRMRSSFSSVGSGRSSRSGRRGGGGGRSKGKLIPGETPEMRKRRQSLKKSAFFQSMMSDFVNQDQFRAAQLEVGEIVGKSFQVVLQRMRGHAYLQLLRGLTEMQQRIKQGSIRQAFLLWAGDVKYFVARRYRRMQQSTLLFQYKMLKASTKYCQGVFFQRWRDRVHLESERDRLRLHLQNVLRRWYNFKRIDVSAYLQRWKRFVVHSYSASMFVDDSLMGGGGASQDKLSQLLRAENVDLTKLKEAAHDDIKRRWAYRDKMAALQKKQEQDIAAQVKKIAEEGGFDSAFFAQERTQTSNHVESEEAFKQLQKDMRKISNVLEEAKEGTDRRIELEVRKLQGELNGFKNLYQLKTNKETEAAVELQADTLVRFSELKFRLQGVEARLAVAEEQQRLGEQRTDPLVATQSQLVKQVGALSESLRSAEERIAALHDLIQQSVSSSAENIESNQRMQQALKESSEYYDVEIRHVRDHVRHTTAGFSEMRRANKVFGEGVCKHVAQVTEDLNRFVMKLPTPLQIFTLCQQYERMWVRLHHEGAEGNEDMLTLPDQLHDLIALYASRIAHHVAEAASRLVLSRWVGAYTGRKTPLMPSSAPVASTKLSSSTQQRLQKPPPQHANASAAFKSVTHDMDSPYQPSGAAAAAAAVSADGNKQQQQQDQQGVDPHTLLMRSELLSAGAGSGGGAVPLAPSPDLVEQVREELLQKYLAEYVHLLRAADQNNRKGDITDDIDTTTIAPSPASFAPAAVIGVDNGVGLPGLLRTNARATFQRKLRRAVDIALTSYPTMTDPTFDANAGAISSKRIRPEAAYMLSSSSRPHTASDRFANQERFCLTCDQPLTSSSSSSNNNNSSSNRYHQHPQHTHNNRPRNAERGISVHDAAAVQPLTREEIDPNSILTLRDVLKSDLSTESGPGKKTDKIVGPAIEIRTRTSSNISSPTAASATDSFLQHHHLHHQHPPLRHKDDGHPSFTIPSPTRIQQGVGARTADVPAAGRLASTSATGGDGATQTETLFNFDDDDDEDSCEDGIAALSLPKFASLSVLQYSLEHIVRDSFGQPSMNSSLPITMRADALRNEENNTPQRCSSSMKSLRPIGDTTTPSVSSPLGAAAAAAVDLLQRSRGSSGRQKITVPREVRPSSAGCHRNFDISEDEIKFDTGSQRRLYGTHE